MIDLKRFRTDNKLGQKDLLELFDCTQGYISSLETGRRVMTEHQKQLIEDKYGSLSDYILPNNYKIITAPINEFNAQTGTPVYDIDATCGQLTRDFEREQIVGYIDLPTVRKDSHIISAYGDSMTPVIMNGDKIAVRQVHATESIYFGQIYLVLTENYRMLKYIRKHQTDNTKIILRSENITKYDDIEMNKNEIIKLFIVENILSIRNML